MIDAKSTTDFLRETAKHPLKQKKAATVVVAAKYLGGANLKCMPE
jgi:hypothetical protein